MYDGFVSIAPPFVPTDIGISNLPTKFSPYIEYLVKGIYLPPKLAYECAAASIALQSYPIAIATASIPFIIPLLCVVALY